MLAVKPLNAYVKVLLPLLAVGVPAETVAPEQLVAFTVKAEFTVATSIASSKVTLTEGLNATPVAPLAGFALATVGGVMSGAAVVKVLTTSLARLINATSLTPVFIHKLYCVLALKVPEGKENTVLSVEGVIAPVIGVAAHDAPCTK